MRKQLFLPAAEKVRVAVRFFANLGYEESLDQAATPAYIFSSPLKCRLILPFSLVLPSYFIGRTSSFSG